MKRKDLTLLIAILMLILLIIMNSCAILESPEARETRKANRYLRKANRFIRKAEQHGAVWRSDTLFKKLEFKVPGVKVQFTPKILTAGKPMIFIKDSVRTVVKVVKGKAGIDTVYVDTECPEQIIYRNVPVAIDNSIQAKKDNTGSWIAALLAFLIIGIVTGYFLRGRHKLTLQIEKPPN